MRLVSWNCHYGLTLKKYFTIMEYKPEILIIQECQKNEFDFIKSLWEYKNWYNDDLNNDESNLGIAIFSNEYKIDFSDTFNRKYRYVVPYRISKNDEEFNLFSIWTKKGPYFEYDENIIYAVKSFEYNDLIKNNSILIGDFNTAGNTECNINYQKLMNNLSGFINCVKDKEDNTTYFHKANGKYYSNDFCLVTEDLYGRYNFNIDIPNNWDKNKNDENKWKGLSDHCPIIIEFKIKR